jgi:plastocyanin
MAGPAVGWRRGTRVGLAVVGVAVIAAASASCHVPKAGGTARSVNGAQEVTIDALDHRFSPRIIDVAAGQPLTVIVHNTGLQSHTFSTNDPLADVVIPARSTRTVTFTPAASTHFFCRFHEADGMKGALCVRGERCESQAFP